MQIFSHCGEGVALVGGTALAGFYAGHRRSDDLDLFTKSEISQRSTVLAIKSLRAIGARILEESQTPLYYHAVCELGGHSFTVDAVLDTNLFRVGKFTRIEPGILVAELDTLLAMKIATLVSRCSEKDLYDLKWLLGRQASPATAALLAMGTAIDGGVTAENLLSSLGGTALRESACAFSLDPKMSPKKILKEAEGERKAWIKKLTVYLRAAPPPPLAALVKEVKRKRRKQ
jgi:hypothetical protein